jgi:PPOX class probable F420-dependent enzyme
MGGMPLALADDLRALLTRPSPCVLTTLLPDGSPHATEVWVDADGDHVLVNSVGGHRKVRNVRSDPRVAVTVLDPDALYRYVGVRGRVVDIATEARSTTSRSSLTATRGARTPGTAAATRCACC